MKLRMTAALLMLPTVSYAGDWRTGLQGSGTPAASTTVYSQGKTVAELQIVCKEPGKLKVVYVSPNQPKTLIPDSDAKPFKIENREVVESERFLKELSAEEAGAKQAGAASFTYIFYLDNPQAAGFSSNMGGLSQAKAFVLNKCSANEEKFTLRPQSDAYLTSQPFAYVSRRLFFQFTADGLAQLINIRTGKEDWRGSYDLSGSTITFNANLRHQSVCHYQYTAQKDLVLSQCNLAGVWVAMTNLR